MLNKHLIAKTAPDTRVENIVLFKDYRISVLYDRLIRIERDVNKKFCDKATQAVWFRNMPCVDFRVAAADKYIDVITEKIALRIYEDFSRSYCIVDGKKRTLDNKDNLLGTYRTLDACDGCEKVEWSGEREKIRLENGVISRSGVAVYDDTSSLILGEDGKLYLRDDDDLDLYVFAYGTDYRAAIKALYGICGAVPMIPKYALGNWWSRYYAYTESEYLHVMDRLSGRDVPITVATVDVDWHWFLDLDKAKQITAQGKNDEYHGFADGKVWGYTGYSWDTDLFPDYKAFLKKLHDRGLHVTLNLHPADGVRYYEDSYAEMAKRMGVEPDTETVIPFDFTDEKFINAYFDVLHKPYEKEGVDFWWIDWQQGTKTAMPGLDPLWALNHYHTLDNATEHSPLILSRYCGVGAHRYPLGFSGDTHVTWSSLAYIPYFTSNATNIGYTWWSHDIGGHKSGIKDDELYVRYVQFGVFSPINRLHCTKMECATKEPTVYMGGSGMIAEEFLRLRHKMIPFLYSAAYDTAHNGVALIEPMYYEYPNEAKAYSCPNQYFFGGQLIVAPVTSPADNSGLARTKVWLPEGNWTDIFTGDEYSGGGWFDMIRWLDTIPVLIKSGGFFVLDGRRHTNDISNSDSLSVICSNGNGNYKLYEDGANGSVITEFNSESELGRQRITVSVMGDEAVIPNRTLRLEMKNIRNGDVRVVGADDYETDEDGCTVILIGNVKVGDKYVVTVDYQPDVKAYRNQRILYALQRIEGSYEKKNTIWNKALVFSTEEMKEYIKSLDYLTARQKKRLMEAW
ncbi:MAG: alpha-xylosidase [Clostridia bacterium]|nr:alpha-xylosidase [Clostridia bacterium]